MEELTPARRELLIGGFMTAMLAGMTGSASASPLNPAETIIIPTDKIPWAPHPVYGGHIQENCTLFGDINKPGPYLTLIRWHVGYMSQPHTYVTDRVCMVLKGTWWCNSGKDYDPASSVPAPAGSFVRRVANTWHYDGVLSGKAEPAEVAVFGIGPIMYGAEDPKAPGWRRA